jgi:hypothetical protein
MIPAVLYQHFFFMASKPSGGKEEQSNDTSIRKYET